MVLIPSKDNDQTSYAVNTAGNGSADIIIGAPNANRSYVVLSNDVIFVNGLD